MIDLFMFLLWNHLMGPIKPVNCGKTPQKCIKQALWFHSICIIDGHGTNISNIHISNCELVDDWLIDSAFELRSGKWVTNHEWEVCFCWIGHIWMICQPDSVARGLKYYIIIFYNLSWLFLASNSPRLVYRGVHSEKSHLISLSFLNQDSVFQYGSWAGKRISYFGFRHCWPLAAAITPSNKLFILNHGFYPVKLIIWVNR